MNRIKDILTKQLSLELPGEEVFFQMGRYSREERLAQLSKIKNPQESSTLLLLYPHKNEPHFVLIKRNTYKGVHSGQIAFPGGRVEVEDPTLQDTALRETWEEVGALPENIEILGALTQVYIPPSNFMLYPFIGVSPNRPDFVLDPHEVQGIIEVPLSKFLSDVILKKGKFDIGKNNLRIDAPYFELRGHRVWGATAIVLSEFRNLIKTGGY